MNPLRLLWSLLRKAWGNLASPRHKLRAWWTLENLSKFATVAFGLAAAVAALSAANWFFLTSHLTSPTVVNEVYIDRSKVQLAYGGHPPRAVQWIVDTYTERQVQSPTAAYDPAAILSQDCVLYSEDINLLMPNTCQPTDSPHTADYPRFVHDLLLVNGHFDLAERDAYLAALAKAHAGVPSPVSLPRFPTETRSLSGDDLRFAYTTLAGAAVDVDVVTVANSGRVAAVNVQVTAPPGLAPVDGEGHSFDLPAQQQKTILYRLAAEPAAPPPTFVALTTDGFAVSSSGSDPYVTQVWAIRALIICGVVLVATVVKDIVDTPADARAPAGRGPASPPPTPGG